MRLPLPPILLLLLLVPLAPLPAQDGPYLASGVKVGEVTATSAIVWTRLTRRPAPNPADGPRVSIRYDAQRRRVFEAVEYPAGVTVDDLHHAVPGAPGEVRVSWKPRAGAVWESGTWAPVRDDADFIRQVTLDDLDPGVPYEYLVEARPAGGGDATASLAGHFDTAPAAGSEKPVSFVVTTGHRFETRDDPAGCRIYRHMLDLAPDFFVHTGDIVYYDKGPAKNVELARYMWQRMYGLGNTVAFHREVSSYFIKDDHDVWFNDCWPGMRNRYMGDFTFEQGQALFLEQVPMRANAPTYRTVRWGKHLQVWMTEGRDYRSPNREPDGPDKTIWGAEQMAWFERTVRASDATFKVLLSPTPVVGPDRKGKNDNHCNVGFAWEGSRLRRFCAEEGMVVACGDRHWQYTSVDPETGLAEYSCGPSTNKHSGGWGARRFIPAYHRYLRVRGGFLHARVDVDRVGPRLVFTHHDVDGRVRYRRVERR